MLPAITWACACRFAFWWDSTVPNGRPTGRHVPKRNTAYPPPIRQQKINAVREELSSLSYNIPYCCLQFLSTRNLLTFALSATQNTSQRRNSRHSVVSPTPH